MFGSLVPGVGDCQAAVEEHEEDADDSKKHEDNQSSLAKLYQQINVVFIACKERKIIKCSATDSMFMKNNISYIQVNNRNHIYSSELLSL